MKFRKNILHKEKKYTAYQFSETINIDKLINRKA